MSRWITRRYALGHRLSSPLLSFLCLQCPLSCIQIPVQPTRTEAFGRGNPIGEPSDAPCGRQGLPTCRPRHFKRGQSRRRTGGPGPRQSLSHTIVYRLQRNGASSVVRRCGPTDTALQASLALRPIASSSICPPTINKTAPPGGEPVVTTLYRLWPAQPCRLSSTLDPSQTCQGDLKRNLGAPSFPCRDMSENSRPGLPPAPLSLASHCAPVSPAACCFKCRLSI